MLYKRQVSATVRSKALHHEFGVSLFQAAYGLSVVAGTLIWDVVPIYTRENHVVQAPLRDGLSDMFRLVRVEGRWCPGQVTAQRG